MSFYNDITHTTDVTGRKPTFVIYNIFASVPLVATEYTISNFAFEKHMGNFYVQRVSWRTIAYTGAGNDRLFRMRDSINTTRDIHTASGTAWAGSVVSKVGGYWTPTSLSTTGDAWFNPGATLLVRDGSTVGSNNTVHDVSIMLFGYYLGY